MRLNVRFKLPTGFRHLFSRKEIKKLKEQVNVRFDRIGFGHITNNAIYSKEQLIHSKIDPVSISGRKDEIGWIFNLYQSAFRAELLPKELEADLKTDLMRIIADYINKIATSKETDLIKRPQLWINVQMVNDRAEIKIRELN